MTAKRYPFAPLERLVVVNLRGRGELGGGDRVKDGVPSIAAECGVGVRQIHRWREIGMLLKDAERAAESAGWVPYEVWPEILSEAIEEVEAADRERDEARRAAQREWWKTRWASMSEEQREAKREYLREYRKHARGAVNASRRRFYQNNREKELARQREYDARRRADRRAA